MNKKEKLLKVLSIVMTTFWSILFIPSMMLAYLSYMATEILANPNSGATEIVVYMYIYMMHAISISIFLTIIFSVYFRRRGKIGRSMLVQGLPVFVFLLSMVFLWILQLFKV